VSGLTDSLPTDIFAVRQIGMERYQEGYFWPVSDSMFFEISRFVFDTFDDLYGSIDPSDRDLVLSDVSFPIFLINIIHAQAVTEICKRDGREVILGPLSEGYYRPNWEEMGREIEQAMKNGNGWHPIRRHLKNLTFNRHLSFFHQMRGIFSPDALALGSASRIRQEYLKRNRIYADNHYWSTLLGQCPFDRPRGIGDKLKESIKEFIGDIEHFCTKQVCAPFEFSEPLKSWHQRLNSLNTIYSFLLEKGPSPKWFLMTEPGRSTNKIVAHALKQKGAKTVTFEHGNATGGLLERSAAYHGPCNCDEYVCPTSESAASFRIIYGRTKVSQLHKVEFTSMETDYYRSLWKDAQNRPFPDGIRKVMIMGHAVTPIRYMDSPGLLFYYQLDLEMRLVDLLKKKDFEVLYKIHPYSARVAMDVFVDWDVQIVAEPFEEVWHWADALLFKFTSSTTFGFALCVNRPIFLLAQEEEYWQPDHYRLLTRRCRMIPSWTNERNRICFDQDRLLEELSAKPETPDFSYVKAYMFPKVDQ
jgi:hypothetical protein